MVNRNCLCSSTLCCTFFFAFMTSNRCMKQNRYNRIGLVHQTTEDKPTVSIWLVRSTPKQTEILTSSPFYINWPVLCIHIQTPIQIVSISCVLTKTNNKQRKKETTNQPFCLEHKVTLTVLNNIPKIINSNCPEAKYTQCILP